MRQLLVTGANGQLGRELHRLLTDDDRFGVAYTDLPELDITDTTAVERFVDAHTPECIINCAAYTAVDAAEDDEPAAERVNCHAIGVLASAAASRGIKMIHVSTDYVFDGQANHPYDEEAAPHPVSAYGRTKLAGEQALLRLLPADSVILRTAWLYSPHGKNFVKTMIELGRSRTSMRVVYDQVGSPTLATDLARAIIAVLSADSWHPGIYHYSNEGAISWYDFAKAIHRLAGITTCDVQPCLSHEYPSPVCRPAYSVFDKSKFKQTFGVTIPHWEESLREFFSIYS